MQEGDNSSHYEGVVLEECLQKPFTAIPIFLILLSILGIIGNFLVIYLILVLREYKKTITNLYLVQLAASDLLFMIFLPVEAHGIVKGATKDYGDGLCKLYQTLRFLSYYSSVFFLTVMSLDRYLAINHAMTSWGMKLRRKRAVYVVSIMVWALCFGSVMPILIRSSVKGCKCSTDFVDTRETNLLEEVDESESSGSSRAIWYSFTNSSNETEFSGSGDYGNGSSGDYEYDYSDLLTYTEEEFDVYLISIGVLPCSFEKTPQMVNSALWNFIGAFTIPLIVIIICYISILRKISRPTKSGAKSNNSTQARQRVTKMVVLLVTTFIICWLPYHIFQLARIKGIPIGTDQCNAVREWLSILAYANSVLNPILYTFMGSNIRSRWKEVIARTRSFRPSIGSRSGYPGDRHSKRNRSHTGDGSSQADFSKSVAVKQLQTCVSRIPQSEDGLL